MPPPSLSARPGKSPSWIGLRSYEIVFYSIQVYLSLPFLPILLKTTFGRFSVFFFVFYWFWDLFQCHHCIIIIYLSAKCSVFFSHFILYKNIIFPLWKVDYNFLVNVILSERFWAFFLKKSIYKKNVKQSQKEREAVQKPLS